MNLYDTSTMLQGIKGAKKAPSFLRDKFFPTSQADIYVTEKVTVDFENDTNEKLAPAVISGAVPVQRSSFQTKEMTAPLIAPSMVLTIEQLNRRMFNESIASDMTAEQREAQYLADDISTLDAMITRTEEYMAAQTLLGNAYTIKQYINGYGTNFAEDFSIDFFGEGYNSNQAVYTGSGWTTSSTNIFSDVKAMCDMLSKKGLPATDLIMGSSAGSVFMNNSEVQKQLDNRRIRIADEIRPEFVIPGVAFIGKVDFEGFVLNVYIYSASYKAINGTDTPYFDVDKIVVTSEGMGRTAYGAISQYENDDTPRTYAERRVPQVLINRDLGNRELRYQSRPLVMPKHLNAAIVSGVV